MKTLLIAIFALSLTGGCATIVQGGPDKVTVDSDVEGARVYLDGQIQGKTPLMVSVPHSSDGVIRIEAKGYHTEIISRNKVLSGWFVGNLLWGQAFPIAMVIDLCTSNQGHYQETPIYVEMKKKGATNE